MVSEEKRHKRKRFLYLMVFLLVVYFTLSFSRSFMAIRRVNEDLYMTKSRVEEMRKRNKELEKEILQLHTHAYIERLAREQLGLVREGEISIVIIRRE